jgi:hypothetical protein
MSRSFLFSHFSLTCALLGRQGCDPCPTSVFPSTVQFFLYVMTRDRKGAGVGSWKGFRRTYSFVPPTTREGVFEVYRNDALTLAVAFETPSANGVDTTTRQSGFCGIASTTVQARARCDASRPLQRRPKHDAWHHHHDGTRAGFVLAKLRRRGNPIICICRPWAGNVSVGDYVLWVLSRVKKCPS